VVDSTDLISDGLSARLPAARVSPRARLLAEDDFELTPADLEGLPPDHPMARYDRERELAILRASIESVKNGEVGVPLRQAFEELSRKHGLGPLPLE
jgi:hypothetical protein